MESQFWSTRGISNETKLQIDNKILLAKLMVCCMHIDSLISIIAAAVNLLFPSWPVIENCSVEQCVAFMAIGVVAFTGILVIIVDI